MATLNPKAEIERLIKVYDSTKQLDRAGYTDALDKIMSDPVAVECIMTKYDMKWNDTKKEFTQRLDWWRELLNGLQKANAREDVLNAVFTHIMDMQNVRPENGPVSISKYGSRNYDAADDSDIAAEPEYMYGSGVVSSNGWISVRRSTRKPTAGEQVTVAGWYYAGVVIYRIATWTGKEWRYESIDPRLPEFQPLYWFRLPEVPDEIMDETSTLDY